MPEDVLRRLLDLARGFHSVDFNNRVADLKAVDFAERLFLSNSTDTKPVFEYAVATTKDNGGIGIVDAPSWGTYTLARAQRGCRDEAEMRASLGWEPRKYFPVRRAVYATEWTPVLEEATHE